MHAFNTLSILCLLTSPILLIQAKQMFASQPCSTYGCHNCRFSSVFSTACSQMCKKCADRRAENKALTSTRADSSLFSYDAATVAEKFDDCCRDSVAKGCWSICRYNATVTEIEEIYLSGKCPERNVESILKCATMGLDSRPCCKGISRLSDSCLRFCEPNPSLKKIGPAEIICAFELAPILKCYEQTAREASGKALVVKAKVAAIVQAKENSEDQFRRCCAELTSDRCARVMCRYGASFTDVRAALDRKICSESEILGPVMQCAARNTDSTECCNKLPISKLAPGCRKFCNPSSISIVGAAASADYKCTTQISQIFHCHRQSHIRANIKTKVVVPEFDFATEQDPVQLKSSLNEASKGKGKVNKIVLQTEADKASPVKKSNKKKTKTAAASAENKQDETDEEETTATPDVDATTESAVETTPTEATEETTVVETTTKKATKPPKTKKTTKAKAKVAKAPKKNAAVVQSDQPSEPTGGLQQRTLQITPFSEAAIPIESKETEETDDYETTEAPQDVNLGPAPSLSVEKQDESSIKPSNVRISSGSVAHVRPSSSLFRNADVLNAIPDDGSLEETFMECCRETTREDCHSLCRYNLTFNEVYSNYRAGICPPTEYLNAMSSCASAGRDNRDCCAVSGVEGYCARFCTPQPNVLDFGLKELKCAQYSSVILSCHKWGAERVYSGRTSKTELLQFEAPRPTRRRLFKQIATKFVDTYLDQALTVPSEAKVKVPIIQSDAVPGVLIEPVQPDLAAEPKVNDFGTKILQFFRKIIPSSSSQTAAN